MEKTIKVNDVISRNQAIRALIDLTIYKSKTEIVERADKSENKWICGVTECIDEIEDLPFLKTDQRFGAWIPIFDLGGMRQMSVNEYRTKEGLNDDRIREDLKKALEMFEDGEVAETADMLMAMAIAMRSWKG